jgi:hypothetical protein
MLPIEIIYKEFQKFDTLGILQFSSLPPEVLYEELQKFDKCIVT